MKNSRSKNEENFDKCFLVLTYWKEENMIRELGFILMMLACIISCRDG